MSSIPPSIPQRSARPSAPPAAPPPPPAEAAAVPASAAPAAPPADRSVAVRTAAPGAGVALPVEAGAAADAALHRAAALRASRREALRGTERSAGPEPRFDMRRADRNLETIRTLQAGHTDRAEEARILGIFRDASRGELNYLVSKLNMADLVSDVDDRLVGPDNRTALLDLLARERLGDLSVASRAAVVDALQGCEADSDPARSAILGIFLGTHGAELTELKNRVDAGGDHRDLQELLNHGLDDKAVRAQILRHIQNEAHGRPSAEVKVLSDVDDTFYASLKDDGYPRKTVYPGVQQFYAELDRGPGAAAGRAGDLGFLTARPWDPVGLLENQTHQLLREHGVPEATVLTGDLLHLLGHERMAEKKVENFDEYRAQYPEYGYVFVGDSGQGDVLAGERMLAHDPKAVRGVFIHDVANTPPAKRQEYRERGVVFFDTYVGAGVEAYDKGLVQREGLVRIAQSALEQFRQVRFDSDAQRQARAAELQRDLARMNERLPPELHVRF